MTYGVSLQICCFQCSAAYVKVQINTLNPSHSFANLQAHSVRHIVTCYAACRSANLAKQFGVEGGIKVLQTQPTSTSCRGLHRFSAQGLPLAETEMKQGPPLYIVKKNPVQNCTLNLILFYRYHHE